MREDGRSQKARETSVDNKRYRASLIDRRVKGDPMRRTSFPQAKWKNKKKLSNDLCNSCVLNLLCEADPAAHLPSSITWQCRSNRKSERK